MSKKNDRKKKRRRMAGRCTACKGTGMGSDGYRCTSCNGTGVAKKQPEAGQAE
jgi:DnaJ-class molecular chaperone